MSDVIRVLAAEAVAEPAVSIKQIISLASIALTVLMLGLSLWKGLRRARLRPLLDVARVVLQAATAVAVPLITKVITPLPLVIAPLAIGSALGAVQGRRLQVEADAGRLFATRSFAGFVVWGIGLVSTIALFLLALVN